jgi:hypothetical protein
MMDGHGRMLLSIIKKCIEKGLDPDAKLIIGGSNVEKTRLLITVCDIVPEVNSFHKLIFPKSITCLEKNMFEIDAARNDIIYLNFGSIGDRMGAATIYSVYIICCKISNRGRIYAFEQADHARLH